MSNLKDTIAETQQTQRRPVSTSITLSLQPVTTANDNAELVVRRRE